MSDHALPNPASGPDPSEANAEPDRVRFRSTPDPATAEGRRDYHTAGVGGLVYANLVARLPATSPVLTQTSMDYVVEFLQTIGNGDPMLEMQAQELLWAHLRLAHLTLLASQQTDLMKLAALNEACEQATATCQKLREALLKQRRIAAYASFPSVMQVNMAQQLIQQFHPAAGIQAKPIIAIPGSSEANATPPLLSSPPIVPSMVEPPKS